MVVDPVCKKEVDENAAAGGKAQYWGTRFYFCSNECRINFRRDPKKYVPEISEGRGPDYDTSKTNESWRA